MIYCPNVGSRYQAGPGSHCDLEDMQDDKQKHFGKEIKYNVLLGYRDLEEQR